MTLAEKLQKRGQLVTQMRAIQEKADGEKRSLNGEEQAQFDKVFAEQEALGNEIAAEKTNRARLTAADEALRSTTDSGIRPAPASSGRPANILEDEQYRTALNAYLCGDLDLRDVRSQIETRTDALQSGLFVKGGALVMPMQMASGLIKAVDDATFMLQLARVERITQAESLGVGTLAGDFDDCNWTYELKTGSDDDLETGLRELKPSPVAKRIKVSNTLLRRTSGGAEALVNERLAIRFGVTFEKAAMTGTGAGQPLGVFTASDNGISTGRDVSTGNSATAIAADNLRNVKGTLKSQYLRNANWLFHREAITMISKLKDGQGQYLWQPGLSADIPDRILGLPYRQTEFAPHAFTASQYVGILGDFKAGYWVVIAMDMTIQRLVELYAEANKTGFIGRMEADAMPVLEEAFVRVKLAAS